MNDYDQKIKQLIEASPSWEKDGSGVRGRTIAPLISGASGANRVVEYEPQQFDQQKRQLKSGSLDTVEDFILSSPSGEVQIPPHPWKITIEDTSTGPTPNFQYKIEPASRLFNGFGGNSITVNGTDGVFRNIETGYYILEISFTETGAVEQAQIEISEDFGDALEFEGDPEKQTKAKIRIGFVYEEEEVYRVRQNAFHNFTLVDACRNGIPIKFPIAT